MFGAITIGEVWRFGMLNRKTKKLYKDIDAFMIPENLEKLVMVLTGILKA